MPARAPASIDMLQTVIRSSIVSPRIAEPRYSMTWPVPPPMPMSRDDRQDDVLGRDARVKLRRRRSRPASWAAFWSRHCVASTCDTSLVPMPKASAPNAPCVLGVAVAADDRRARLREPELGPDHVHDPLAVGAEGVAARRRSPAQLVSSAAICAAAALSSIGILPSRPRGVVGVEWSMVATVRSGRRTESRARAAR